MTTTKLFSTPTNKTTMKKTPISARFTRQLIKVNDQVCFSALRHWEFEQTLAPLAVSRPGDFSPAVFSTNPFAETIFRKIADLPVFSRESEQVELRMGVIASVEYSLAYLEDVQTFRQSLVTSEGDEIKNDAEEEQLRLKIERWSARSPVPGYFRTLGYLRLLRNHYAHVNDTPHTSLKTYISLYGKALNKFWDNGITNLHGVDFRTLATIALTPDLTFGIMNVLRVCLQRVDHFVAETLTLTDAVRFVLNDILQSPKSHQLRIDGISSKVRARLRMDWNIVLGLPAVTQEVKQVMSTRS